jgi:hypothetical protein
MSIHGARSMAGQNCQGAIARRYSKISGVIL